MTYPQPNQWLNVSSEINAYVSTFARLRFALYTYVCVRVFDYIYVYIYIYIYIYI